jgi:squalene monooxygenase
MTERTMLYRSTQAPVDVAIVGAGPCGCAAALAHAQAGARVLLLEACESAHRRLAGEWLHPGAVGVLARLGVAPPGAAGRGFVVFPDDGGAPIELPYAGGGLGASVEHTVLVESLRAAAAANPAIRLVHGRATGVAEGRVTYEGRGGGDSSVAVERIVGADGRSSLVRRFARIAEGRTRVSHVAGLVLDVDELPFEGFGHVLLGGPGPVLLYRLGAGRVRACVDRPGHPPRDAAGTLWDEYAAVFPPALVPALAAALRERPPQWAAACFRPRSRQQHYGKGDLALVGDAVGEFHPLTAVGMTLGLADAEELARASSVKAYRRTRAAGARVPELLGGALYEAFTRRDEGTLALRRAIYALWRQSAAERELTMRLLAVEETGVGAFSRTFLKVLGGAARAVGRDALARRAWPAEARGLARWVGRLAAGFQPV